MRASGSCKVAASSFAAWRICAVSRPSRAHASSSALLETLRTEPPTCEMLADSMIGVDGREDGAQGQVDRQPAFVCSGWKPDGGSTMTIGYGTWRWTIFVLSAS